MEMQKRIARASALLVLLALGACSEKAVQPQEGVLHPQSHYFVNFAPDAPEAEYVAVCKVGPPGTYSFHAQVTAGVGEPGNLRTLPTRGPGGTGAPLLYGDTDLDGQTDFSITVAADAYLTWGGQTVQGDCFEAAGVHSDVAFTGGPDVTIAISETNLPAGTEFVKTDLYSSTGSSLNNPPDYVVTSMIGQGNPVSIVVSGSKGANAIFYNQLIPAPALTITKTADAASVPAGSAIGFTVTVSNEGPGVANNVVITDPLPTGIGVSWSISPAVAGCSITGNMLTCDAGDLAASSSFSVHLTSPTTFSSCGLYSNTASALADNHPPITATADMTVTCPSETPCPAGSFSFSFNANGDLLIRYDQFPAPNDNSYGVNAVGWPNGHRFSDLYNSDHAGFQLRDASGVIKLQFNVDYLTADLTAPSGYASKGVLGGDGKMLVGTSTGITATTSLANNLNNVNIPGLFSASHVQQFGSVNVLVNSPPTDAAHQTYSISDAALAGWDFHNTYFVTISAAKLASIGFDPNTWSVEPSPTQLHNSPAKPCPPGPAVCNLGVTKYEVKDKQVKVTILNSASTDVFLTQIALNWPLANGKLTQIKLDGGIIYDQPDIAGGSATLTTGQLVADQNKRKIAHGQDRILNFIFQNNADANLANYTSQLMFGTCDLTILPH